jgi:hypothetical protein
MDGWIDEWKIDRQIERERERCQEGILEESSPSLDLNMDYFFTKKREGNPELLLLHCVFQIKRRRGVWQVPRRHVSAEPSLKFC